MYILIDEKEKSMEYSYTTMIDVIKRISEDDTPRHIRRQLERLTSDERRKVRQLMDYVEMELSDIDLAEEHDERFSEIFPGTIDALNSLTVRAS